MKNLRISDIADAALRAVRAEQLIKTAALDTVKETEQLTNYRTELGYKLRKLAAALANYTPDTTVRIQDVEDFVRNHAR